MRQPLEQVILVESYKKYNVDTTHNDQGCCTIFWKQTCAHIGRSHKVNIKWKSIKLWRWLRRKKEKWQRNKVRTHTYRTWTQAHRACMLATKNCHNQIACQLGSWTDRRLLYANTFKQTYKRAWVCDVCSKLILRYCKVYNKVTGYRGRVAINKSVKHRL